MQAVKKSSPPPQAPPVSGALTGDLSGQVREETLEALTKAKVIQSEERVGFQKYLIANEVNSGEIFPVMAHLRGISEDEKSVTMTKWARAITPIVKRRHPLVPFAGKIYGSSSFFGKYGAVKAAAAEVKCPLIYAEEADAVGFGTLNPVAGLRLGEFVAEYLKKKTGIQPFVSVFLLDAETWSNLNERQFDQ